MYKYGMLWFDKSDKVSLQDKILIAVQYFEKKYGTNILGGILISDKKEFVLTEEQSVMGDLKIEKSNSVSEDYFYLWVKDEFECLDLRVLNSCNKQ